LNDDMTEIADLPAVARASAAALAGYTDLDWQQVPAADLQWSCWQTALHIADRLYFYAMQVVYGQPDGYLCTELALDDSASPPRLLAALSAPSCCTALRGPLTQTCARITTMVSRTQRGSPRWASWRR
jgi:hypothetical protein